MTNLKTISQNLSKAIVRKDKKNAWSLFSQGLQEHETNFIAQIKKDGVLRCSFYNFQGQTIKFLISELKVLNVSPDAQIYFESIKSLLYVSSNVQEIFKDLLREVNKLEMKSYLIALDLLFYSDTIEKQQIFKQKDQEYFLSKEDIASSFSLYYYYIYKNNLLKKQDINKINKDRLSNQYYINKLKEFYKIIIYKEYEILIDKFGYLATKNKNNISLNHQSENFEKSLDYGYIYNFKQEIAHALNSYSRLNKDIQSFHDWFEKYYKKMDFHLFEIIDKHPKRIRLKVVDHPILKEIVNSEKLYLEDYILISKIEKDLFVTLDDLYEIKVYKSLSIIDIIRIQRLFRFLFLHFKKLKEKYKNGLIFSSILPVFNIDEFKNFLTLFFIKSKAEEAIEILSWNPSKNKIYDIQYYPFVNIENLVILPLGILSISNLAINILKSTQFRFDSKEFITPIERLIKKFLEPRSTLFRCNIEYDFKKKKGDIDTLAIIDNCLFIFECKNSLHPCNLFELRTSYDYIIKGTEQLNRFQELWNDQEFKHYLENKLEIAVDTLPSKFYSCIIMGNRMFSGLHEQGYAIRSVHQLCSFINYGKIDFHHFNPLNPDENNIFFSFNLWEKDIFTVNDLIKYIQEDSFALSHFNDMEKLCGILKLGDIYINKNFYLLNPEKLSSYLNMDNNNLNFLS